VIRFGTMSWIYDDWRGPLYAAHTKHEKMLAELSRIFSVVEIDATFFGLPRPTVLAGWANQTEKDFRFTAKLPRAITHEKRLTGNAAEDALSAAEAISAGLRGKLACLLVQLPAEIGPADRRHVERFFTEVAGQGFPLALELRDTAWLKTDIADFLQAHSITLVTTEKVDFGHPPAYLRLLGEDGSVARFDARQFDRSAELDTWATRLKENAVSADALVFVRNFYEGHAPATLFALMKRLGYSVPVPPGQQQMSLF
jgi:uncharacterized protein YecE (DUF72 family)